MRAYKEVVKPWGSEKWIDLTDSYCFKEIVLLKGCRTSLQYHEMKQETNFISSGRAILTYRSKDSATYTSILVGPGFSMRFEPGDVHRFEALEDVTLYECSTIHVDDVVRLEDSYGREDKQK